MNHSAQIYWLEKEMADVPSGDKWLTPGEHARQQAFSVHKRRDDWRLGRWTAKCAVAGYLGLPMARIGEIEVRTSQSGAPEVAIAGDSSHSPRISISHREHTAFCAVTTAEDLVGCDLEVVEERSAAFVADYFTPGEQALVLQSRNRPLVANLFWSAKESTLKALNKGLTQDTRSLEIETCCAGDSELEALDGRWQRISVSCDGRMFFGWWRREGSLLRTVVGSCREPIKISPAA